MHAFPNTKWVVPCTIAVGYYYISKPLGYKNKKPQLLHTLTLLSDEKNWVEASKIIQSNPAQDYTPGSFLTLKLHPYVCAIKHVTILHYK